MADNYDIYQRKFIYLLLHNREIVNKWLDSPLKNKHFESKYRTILNSIVEANDRDSLLTKDTFLASLKGKVPNSVITSQELALNSCLMMRAAKEDDLHLLQTTIIEHYVLENTVISIKEFQKKHKDYDTVFSVKKLISDLQDIINVSTDQSAVFEHIGDYGKKFLKHLQDVRDGKVEQSPRVLCNIKEIDETMAIGFAPGTLTLFCSDVGGYKSTMMLNVGLNVWQEGHSVLFVPLEMPYDQMYSKLLAREARIDSDKIIKADLTDEEMQKLKETQDKVDKIDNKFYVLKPTDRVTVQFIKRQIEKHIEIFQPKLVVIDYIINLLPDSPRRDGRNDLEIGDMLKSLRAIGASMGFAVVSAAQLGRESLKRIRKMGSNTDRQMLHSEDIRGSHEFAADADTIYAQVPDTADVENALGLYVIKSRYGPKIFPGGGMKATLTVIPELSLIRSDSDGMPDEDIVSKEYSEFEETQAVDLDSTDLSDTLPDDMDDW